jgi:hypothetical protein
MIIAAMIVYHVLLYIEGFEVNEIYDIDEIDPTPINNSIEICLKYLCHKNV